MNIQVTPHEWLKLPLPTRLRLVEIFNIPKSEGSKVEQLAGVSVLLSDGYTLKDLENITIEKMQGYLNAPVVDADFGGLFDRVINMIETGTRPTPILEVKPPVIDPEIMKTSWETLIKSMKQDAIAAGLEVELRKILAHNSKKATF